MRALVRACTINHQKDLGAVVASHCLAVAAGFAVYFAFVHLAVNVYIVNITHIYIVTYLYVLYPGMQPNTRNQYESARVYNRRILRTVVVAAEAADKVCSLDKNKFMRGSEGLLLLLPCGAVLSNAV